MNNKLYKRGRVTLRKTLKHCLTLFKLWLKGVKNNYEKKYKELLKDIEALADETQKRGEEKSRHSAETKSLMSMGMAWAYAEVSTNLYLLLLLEDKTNESVKRLQKTKTTN